VFIALTEEQHKAFNFEDDSMDVTRHEDGPMEL
jgi:hypothetical protein